MHRKITRTGPATLTIAIPAKWAKRKNLKPGDEVKITETDNKLIISVSEKESEKVRIQYNEALLSEMLNKLYFDNTENITIYSETEIPNTVHKTIQKFPGLKIIEETSNKIQITQALKPETKNQEAILRRAMLIIKQSLEHNPPKFPSDTNDLLFLSQIGQQDKTLQLSLYDLYETLSSIQKPLFDEAHGVLKILFDMIYSLKYSFNPVDAIKMQDVINKTEKSFPKYFKKGNIKDIAKAHHCFKIIEGIRKSIIGQQTVEILSERKISKKRFNIGVCLKNYSNPFWRDEVGGGIETVANKHKDADFLVQAPLDYPDLKEQARILNQFVDQGMDAIILAPNHPSALHKQITKINKAKIPLIIIDTDLEIKEANYKFVGWDNYNGGRMTAEYICKKFPKKTNMLVVEGHPIANWMQRTSGFKDYASKKHKIEIIQAEFQQSKAYEKTLTYLKNHRPKFIFATSDNMAVGVIQAIKELKLKIPVSGFDYTQEGKNALKSRDMLSSINTKPKQMGLLAAEMAYDLLSGKTVADRVEYDIELVTK